MKRTRSIVALAIAACLPVVAFADNRDTGVNGREHNQQARIRDGVCSCELTNDEMRELRSDQKSIGQEARAYKSDGKLTRAERTDLHQDRNAASRNLYAEKHDAERRN